MKVLVAEDDADLADVVSYALRREGYSATVAIDGQQALLRWESEHPDIVLLDVSLPKMSGFDVCRRIRHEGDTPIILVTAHTREEDIVRGLQLGADDYVVKPFSVKQLVARIQAVLRRYRVDRYQKPTAELHVADLALDPESHEATKQGDPLSLTPLEFRILYLLAMNAGRVVPSTRLVEYAWKYDGGDPSVLKTHIYHVRRKLAEMAGVPCEIKAAHGVGYRLVYSEAVERAG